MRPLTILAGVAFAGAAGFLIFVPEWTGLPARGRQIGYPPTSMIEWQRDHMREPVSQVAPAALPMGQDDGKPATQVYKNVQVLKDVSAAEFMRLQYAITAWVSPKQGCDYCHTGNDYAADDKATKLAARVMLTMVRHMNADWGQHVNPAGVTCFTCHRGQPVPAETWFPSTTPPVFHIAEKQDNWRETGDTVRKFFPDAGWDLYLLEDTPIGVQSTTALPSHTVAQQVVVKRVYEMMMQMSDGIGVNCGYCHNSRVFESWEQSTPYRWNGYSGIQMTRDLNRNYLLRIDDLVPETRELVHKTSLPVLPARDTGRLTGDGLVVCATCHYAEPQPLGGANMVKDYPGLSGH